ncbi:MAG TPA: zf-HC2 domain-containing protein [Chloroflexota bacterium]|nr:zf-HC2 domain-containing protein [Chloroflexota bacterium]
MVAEVARRRDCLAGYDEGLLKTYLDGELTEAWREQVEAHVGGCASCTARLARLRQDGALVWNRLAALERAGTPGMDVPRRPAVEVVLARARRPQSWQELALTWWRERVPRSVFSARPLPMGAGLAAGVVLLAGVAATQPAVQSFAQGMLRQFRVQQVQPVTVDPAALRRLPIDGRAIESLSQVGTYQGPQGPKVRLATVAEASNATGLGLRGPRRLPAQVPTQPQVMVSEPVRFTFTYDGPKLVQLAKDVGIKDEPLLRELQGLHGVTVTGDVPAAAAVLYGESVAADLARGAGAAGTPAATPAPRPVLALVQLKSPVLQVPNQVNVNLLRERVAQGRSSGTVPAELANPLLAIADWTSTLPVPVMDGSGRQVTVDGAQGTLVTGREQPPMLIWQKDGVVYLLTGRHVSEQDILDAAASLAPLSR